MDLTKINKLKALINKIMPSYTRLPLIIVVVFNFSVYGLTRLYAAGKPHYVMTTALDQQIPFLPWTLIIYFSCYIYWIAFYLLCSGEDKERGLQFLLADILGKIVCAFFYLFVPTTMERPVVTEPGFWNEGIRFLYQLDPADNLFPSLHCFISWLCYAGVRGNRKYPKSLRVFALVYSLMVFVSTLTTKQHVIVDVIAGYALAEGCYFIARKIPVLKLMEKCRKKKSNKGD